MDAKNARILIAPEFYERAIAASDNAVMQAVATAVRMVRGTQSIGGGCSFMGSEFCILPRRAKPTDDVEALLITDRLLFLKQSEFEEAIEAALPLPIA